MIKLTKILSELLNTFEIQAEIFSIKDESINHILDSIRAIKSITTIRNITPPEYVKREGIDYTLVSIKFVTREDIKQILKQIKSDILVSNKSNLRIPGIKNFRFKIDTLKRL